MQPTSTASVGPRHSTSLGVPAAAVAVVFALPAELCLHRNRTRPRVVRPAVVRRQAASLRHIRTDLEGEGYAAIHIFGSESDMESEVVLQSGRLPCPPLGGENWRSTRRARATVHVVLWVYRWFFNPVLVWLLRSPFH